MTDTEHATAPAPTEDETQSIHAWARADDDPELSEVSERRSWKLPVTLVALAAAAAVTVGAVQMWPHHDVKPQVKAVNAAAVAYSIAMAQPPKPPSTDDKFIADLSARWGMITDRPGEIHDGISVCGLMARGATRAAIQQDMVNKHVNTPADAEFFVNTAVNNYCPPL
jgi:hypothetical protein